MTRERAKELLPVIQAWAEGKVIQSRPKNRDCVWNDLTHADFRDYHDYRIKPEPREIWVHEHLDTLRDAFFSASAAAAAVSSGVKIIKFREVIE